jgi:hypothetical protein
MPPSEAHLTKYHTARPSLSMDCCDLLDIAPKDGKAAADGEIRIVFVVFRPAGCMRELRLLMPTTAVGALPSNF